MTEIRYAPDRHVVHYSGRIDNAGVLVEKYGNRPVQATLNLFYAEEGVLALDADEMDALAEKLREGAVALRDAT